MANARGSVVLLWPLLLEWPQFLPAQSQATVFVANTNLQSIAVQVIDKQGNHVKGLSASDFTLLEDGHPQKIAFFEAEAQPISLAILIDSGRSMDFGGKLDRARVLLGPLIRSGRPEDEIFLMPFTDQVGTCEQLSPEQRLQPPIVASPGHRGSALYDALASALCHMRTAENVRQAVVVITDGMDEHSRLKLEQLIELVRSSSPQVFTVGLFNQPEYEVYRQRHKTVTIVGLREIDNPVIVFDRLAKESGAESFFPVSEQDFKKALDRITALLEAEYTLAYYPQRIDKVRKIEVKVSRAGVRISARERVGSENTVEGVHFSATACEVSAKDHPYTWASRVTSSPSSPVVYHEDFSDPRSGWPNRPFDSNTCSSSHYIAAGYELNRSNCGARRLPTVNGVVATAADTAIAAYGPFWGDNFRASALLETHVRAPVVGMVFDVMEEGYYAFLLAPENGTMISSTLIKGRWDGTRSTIMSATSIVSLDRPGKLHKLTVERNQEQITLLVDDQEVGSVRDTTFPYGLVGFGVFGEGRITVHDLLVEAIP
jgi:VWFA-related protein